MHTYDHKNIEAKWQARWAKQQVDKTDKTEQTKEKYYILDMLPYPSADGLHMGHTESYTASDIMYRVKRMQGYTVLHKQAFDSFGLPAENFAIKTGVHPAETVKICGENYLRQMKSLGFGYDYGDVYWTSSPEYYTWTQRLFVEFYKNDLVYRDTQTVNWCPSCNTTLANEQVDQGQCERCKSEVVQKKIPGWYFRITNFADDLIHKDTDQIDWPEHTKKNQNTWIGKSEGARVGFEIKGFSETIEVFTTRPDTIFGATYIVLAPEHVLLSSLSIKLENKEEVDAYIEATAQKSELERLENKEKTGVRLEGVHAINPANGEETPVFIADYVLAEYGTGAIMAVPAHDERDNEFAQKFGLPIKQVIFKTIEKTTSPDNAHHSNTQEEVYAEHGLLQYSGQFDGMESREAGRAITEFVGGEMTSTYRLKDWSISRQRYWGAPIPIVYDLKGNPHVVPTEHLPWELPTDVDFVPKGTAPLADSQELIERTERIFGEGWRPETDTMDTFVCSSWYFLRYPDSQNTTEWCSQDLSNYWQPVDLYIGGAEHTYMHLLYARFWVKAMQSIGLLDHGEPFTKLRHQGYVLDEQGKKMSKSSGNVVNPNEVVERFGADATRLYMMFAGPLEDGVVWNENGVVGMYRFIEKVWRQQEKTSQQGCADIKKLVHKTIKKVSEDCEELRFNTAISAMMICVNEMDKQSTVDSDDYEALVKLLSVFAPHVSQEIMSLLGSEKYISDMPWPQYDKVQIIDYEVELAVQVNGKTRGIINLDPDASEEVALDIAQANLSIAKWLEGVAIKKVVYVPGRILSIVVG